MDWFWLWMLFVLVFFLLPLGYGWGYRGWGAPYPSYYWRRRTGSTPPAADPYAEARAVKTEEMNAWGIVADLVWIALLVALGWLLIAWIF